jgi:hypothetical protein
LLSLLLLLTQLIRPLLVRTLRRFTLPLLLVGYALALILLLLLLA